MAVSPYFNNNPFPLSGEQLLLEDLLNEQVYLYGQDCYYILRESADEVDYLLGEDPTSIFQKAFKVQMLLLDTEDWRSGGDLFAKFGLQINKQTVVVVTRRHFEQWVGKTNRPRPMEGDLVYIPVLGGRLFEIKYADEEKQFFTHGKRNPYYYELQLEQFRYSHEDFSTGFEELDDIEADNSFTIDLYVTGGNTNFHIGEPVSQGDVTARISKWDIANSVVSVFDIKGEFETGNTIIGANSGATWTISTYSDLEDSAFYSDYQNIETESTANAFIVTTETSPFAPY